MHQFLASQTEEVERLKKERDMEGSNQREAPGSLSSSDRQPDEPGPALESLVLQLVLSGSCS